MFSAIALVLFAIGLVIVGKAFGSTRNTDDYHIASWGVRSIAIAFGSFTVLGAQDFVGTPRFLADMGLGALALYGGYAVGAIILACLAPRLASDVRDKRCWSLPDYVAPKYGRVNSLLITCMQGVALLAVLIIQLTVAGSVLHNLIPSVTPLMAIIAVSIVVALYVIAGGFRAILATDMVQGIAMFALLIALAAAAHLYQPSQDMVAPLEAVTSSDANANYRPLRFDASLIPSTIALFVIGVTAILGGADIWQRFLSGRTSRASRNGMFLAAGMYAIFGIVVIVVSGVIMQSSPGASPDTVFLDFIRYGMPSWLFPLAALGLFAAILSTADAEIMIVASMTTRELERWGLNRRLEIRDTWLGVCLLSIVAVIGSTLLERHLVAVYYGLLILLLTGGPIALIVIFNRSRPGLLILGQLLSLLITLLLWWFGKLADGMWPLLIVAPLVVQIPVPGKVRGDA